MANGDYPRPPVPESHYPDKPFGLRQPPQEHFGGFLTFLAVIGLHLWWSSHTGGQKLALGRWLLPLEIAVMAPYSFWVYGRAKRTNRPKTARLWIWTAIVLLFLSLATFGFTSYLVVKVERAVGPGWERKR